MLNYTLRRLMFAVPTLLVISFIIFALLDLAPNDPTGNLPLTIPPEVREQIRQRSCCMAALRLVQCNIKPC